MRASARGMRTYGVFLTLAVIGSEGRANVVYAKLERSGLYVTRDERLRERRPDGAAVLHAVDRDEPEAMLELVAESDALTAPAPGDSARRRAAFQPIWSLWPMLGTLGFELLVVDDEDATRQLDTLYTALAGDPLLMGINRSQLTIRPRGRWSGYGHPDVSSDA